MNLAELKNQAYQFLTNASAVLDREKIAFKDHWHIDHLCYRTASDAEYAALKQDFCEFSKLLIESMVNGRLISTFKLAHPIVFRDWEIDLIELPAPKLHKPSATGFEHFEVVCDETFEEIATMYGNSRFEAGAPMKDFNAELEMSLDGFAVKFHQLSLESVINLENNSRVYSAIAKLDVLKKLKEFSPLVAGTFPLKIDVESSDVDLLINFNSIEQAEKKIIELFSELQGFRIERSEVMQKASLVANFVFDDVEFEIFGQNTPSVQQDGYRHFLIEERLLKLGGPEFFNKVMRLRRQGLKTEPAFATALALSGDPYQQLLTLQKLSNAELKKYFQEKID